MTRKALIAEITTKLKQYDESSLIDYRSLNRWIKNELKRFGSNVTILTEKVLKVENGKATLPDNFFNLELAVKCNPFTYNTDIETQKILQSSTHWTQRLEVKQEWDNASESHIGTDYKYIEENIYYQDRLINVKYNNITPLRIVRGMKRENCSATCKNFNFHSSPYEINIIRDTLQTNFREGYIYIQYNGLPVDEEGDLYIPDVTNLQEYLITFCTRNILEDVWLNSDDENLVNKLTYISSKERNLFSLAMTTLKMEALSKGWEKKIKRKIIKESNRYERMFPKR